jgi:hypothetical protein
MPQAIGNLLQIIENSPAFDDFESLSLWKIETTQFRFKDFR